jgi:putative SOS response-associated peptidase YedK
MCYSARIVNDYRRYVRDFGAELSLKEFVDLFWHRRQGAKVKVPKALELAFADPQNDAEREIKTLIDAFAADEEARLQQELFKQKKRLADAQRSLLTKTTKKAQDDRRISSDKIEGALGKLAALHRTEATEDDDHRIFPGSYAPVMVVQAGRRVVLPMRYQCRPAGAPAFYDAKFPGTYNARRDNLEGKFWKKLFGVSHGLVLASAFYEHVDRPGPDGKSRDVVLEFRPSTGREMLVACLWSRWTAPGEPDLLSFAAITDEPPPEVAAAGHDRCVIPIKLEYIDAWLNPNRSELAKQYAILDDRERPYYEHRLAA